MRQRGMKQCASPAAVMTQLDDPYALAAAVPDPLLVTDLFHIHSRRLVGVLTVFTGDLGEAEELAQEAFARVYSARGRIRDGVGAQSYLYSTAFNLARSRWRRGRTLQRALRRLGSPDPVPAADAVVLQAATSATTTAAVTALPARQRACVVLHYYGELSVADVAEVLDISANSVKTHLQRGLASLRISLGSEDPT
jgi:RNA polymerase sigma-70 factor (sigma-E family)